MLCTFVPHHLLAAVEPQVTVLAGNVTLFPTLIPSRNIMNSPTILPSTPRCQQMSATLHVLLETEPCLKGDVANGTVDSPRAFNLARYLSCSI